MSYRGRREGNYGSNRKRHGQIKHPFPKKQLDELLTIDRKLETLQSNIDLEKHNDIREDVIEADNKVWKAINKADKSRGN